MECYSRLTFLLLLIVFLDFANSYFLRGEELLENEEHLSNSRLIRLRGTRSAPESWHSEIRKRAISFGQSDEELKTVQNYLLKLKELADDKYPDLSKPILTIASSNNQVKR